MNVFFTADTHFEHYNIVLHALRLPWMIKNEMFDISKPYHFKYNNNLAVKIAEHNNDLIDNWNAIVSKKDIVYILGDFAWKNHNKYIMQLNGKKILIMGNHDKINTETSCNFTECHNFGVRKIINQQEVIMSHYGMRTWAGSYRGSWQLYGHSHGRLPEFKNSFSFDVGVDVWGYEPVPYEAVELKMQLIKEYIRQNNIKSVDGENEAISDYSSDLQKRVCSVASYNKEIKRKIGMAIKDNYWIKYEDVLDDKYIYLRKPNDE